MRKDNNQYNNKNINYFTYIVITILIGYIILSFIANYYSLTDILLSIHDKDVYGYEYIHIYKERAKVIGNGLSTIGQGIGTIAGQIGLCSMVVTITTCVTKCIANSFMPPLQKAGVVIGSSVVAGIIPS